MNLWQHIVGVEYQAVLLSCLILATRALTLTTKNGFDESETFIKCTSVTLECTNQPYSGYHSWKYDSKIVAECIVGDCNVLTDDSEFTFEPDTTNGMFRWKIGKAKGEYEDKLLECFDGTNTKSVVAKFDNTGGVSYIYVIVITVLEVITLIIILGTAWYQLKKKKWTTSDSEATTDQDEITLCKVICSFLLPLGKVIAGVLLTVILIPITRYVNDSVIEYFDKICCWEILLILFGLYIVILISIVIMIWMVYRKLKNHEEGKGLNEEL